MQNYTTIICKTLQQNPHHPYTIQQLCITLQINSKSDKKKVKKALLHLVQQGKIKKLKRGGYVYPPIYVTGRVDYVRTEYAYIIAPDQPIDILVHQKNLLNALDKDLVKVCLFPRKHRKRPEGVVVEIIERNTAPIIGRITLSGKQSQAIFEQKRTTYTVLLDEKYNDILQENDKVVIALTSFPNKPLAGTVVEHLGQAGLHEVEMHAIMAEFGLKERFPDDVMESIKNIPMVITEKEITKRRDLRHIPTFTIDPVDAKDFDDALSYQPLANGHHQVAIHIADVSHYVVPDSLLDKEAYARNTSVYLVDRCIPMLPEILSNGLCSLRPNETKLTFSAIFELDGQGNVYDKWLGETIIYSDKRFSYEEAQMTIDHQKGDFYQALTVLNDLAKQLHAKRSQKGAINFETRSLVFDLDTNGKPLTVTSKCRTDAHKLIEEFMLLANQEVATYAAKLKQEKLGPTFIYRTHGHPDPDKLNDFFLFVNQLGYKINRSKTSIYKAMHDLEKAIQGKKEAPIIQSLAIRSMAKALYTTKPDPHFALAFAHYTHFTSPIRRYPDILVHRLLKQYLKGEYLYDVASYEKKCQYAVEKEYLAATAERASIKYKQVEFIQNLKEQIFEGIISGITEWNMYIEILSNGCEGMVRLSDLTDDVYAFEEKHFQVVGKWSKKCYRLGDIVKVKVKNCDLDKRHINFWLC